MPGFFPVGGAPVGALPIESAGSPLDVDIDDTVTLYEATDRILLNVLEDAADGSMALGETELLNVLFTSALILPDAFGAMSLRVNATDTANGADVTAAEYLPHLKSWVLAGADANAKMRFKNTLAESGGFTDTIAVAWNMLLADTGDGDDTIEGTVKRLAALADALAASAIADGRLSARVAVAVAAVLEANVGAGWAKTLADQADILDQVQNILRAMNTVADSAAIADTAVGSMILSLVCADDVALADALAASGAFNADLSDSALLYCSFRLGGTDYSGWAVNTDLRAVTEHRNQPFDSIVSHQKGFHYAAGPGGIVQFTGTTDDGEPIEAWFRTFLTDFGTHKFKRAPDIWVGIATDGRMLAKVRTRDPASGAVLDDWYELVTKQDGNEGNGRAKVGRGLKSVWWGMEVRNIAGSDFRIDEAGMRYLVLDRRQ